MKDHDKAIAARREEQVAERLDRSWHPETATPVMKGGNISFTLADKVRGVVAGGIGLVERVVDTVGLRECIDKRLKVLKRHLPYHESDHVLTMAYNLLAGGQSIEDIELLRSNVSFLDAVGARRIPDPTTAGDFLRRFGDSDVEDLMEAANEARVRVWRHQRSSFRRRAVIDVDATVAETTGEKKEGADFSYKGEWGYGPLVVTLANTGEVLYTVNRSANRPSHDGSVPWIDRAIEVVRRGGFREVMLRGDTDFSLTRHFDAWSDKKVWFVFGVDANRSFVNRAEELEERAWTALERPGRHTVKTKPRARRRNVKDTVIRARGFKNKRLEAEAWAEFEYTPARAQGSYRMVVVRKNISVEKGDEGLYDEIRYFFYATNIPAEEMSAEEVIHQSNARCNQEKIIEQLKNGVQAMRMPAGDLVSNWAYMVIATLAWNLKAWMGLVLPKRAGAGQLLKMGFRTFLNSVILIPAQIKRGARRLIFALLSYSRWSRLILEGSERLRQLQLT